MKNWYQSKTIIVNVLMAVLGLVSEVSQVFPISQNPKVWIVVTSLLNIALRFITTSPLTK